MATINGTDGNDVLTGTPSADLISGLNGNDSLDGADGNDTLRGGAGMDSLSGEDQDNTLDGGDGNDVAVFAGNAADYDITRVPSYIQVTSAIGEIDRLIDVVRLQFDDKVIDSTAIA